MTIKIAGGDVKISGNTIDMFDGALVVEKDGHPLSDKLYDTLLAVFLDGKRNAVIILGETPSGFVPYTIT